MTLNENEKKNLIDYRLEQADETIQDVKLLVNNERYRSAINRIYYGMFYALSALAIANNFQTSKHGQLIGWFNKEFIYKGLVESKYGKMINKAYNFRTEGDYDVFIEYDRETTNQLFLNMKEFIRELKEYIYLNSLS